MTLGVFVASAMALQAFDQERLMQSARKLGPRAVSEITAWQRLIGDAGADHVTDKLTRVNQFFNQRVRFLDDRIIWAQVDYWATPLETLNKGQGDCEDFSVAKYVSLLALGMPADKLRLIYVRARIGGPSSSVSQAHMVLAYYPSPNEDPLILDNLINAIRPASQRPDLTPVFSFNIEGLWRGVGSLSAGDPSVRLSRWRDLLARMKEEGFL